MPLKGLAELTELVNSPEFIGQLKLEIHLWLLHSTQGMSRDEGMREFASNRDVLVDLLNESICRGASLNMLMLLQKQGHGNFVIMSSKEHTWLQNDKGIIIDATIGQYTKKEQVYVGTIKNLPKEVQKRYVKGKPDTILQRIFEGAFKTWTNANLLNTRQPQPHGIFHGYSPTTHTPVNQPRVVSQQDQALQIFAESIAKWQEACVKDTKSKTPVRSVEEWKIIISSDFSSLEQRGYVQNLKLDHSISGNYMMAMRDHVLAEAKSGTISNKEERLSSIVKNIENMPKPSRLVF